MDANGVKKRGQPDPRSTTVISCFQLPLTQDPRNQRVVKTSEWNSKEVMHGPTGLCGECFYLEFRMRAVRCTASWTVGGAFAGYVLGRWVCPHVLWQH